MRPLRAVTALVLTVLGLFSAATSAVAQTADATSAPAVAPSLTPTIPPSSSSSASSSLPDPTYPADPARRYGMLQSVNTMMLEQRRLNDQTRSAMLGSLTPAHRAYVASLVGQLATAPAPDAAGTARQIDATLSPSERQGVLRADAERLARERDVMRHAFSDLSANMTPDERAALQQRMAKAQSDLQHLTPQQRAAMTRQAQEFVTLLAPGSAAIGTPQTAGDILLHTLTTHANVMGM